MGNKLGPLTPILAYSVCYDFDTVDLVVPPYIICFKVCHSQTSHFLGSVHCGPCYSVALSTPDILKNFGFKFPRSVNGDLDGQNSEIV